MQKYDLRGPERAAKADEQLKKPGVLNKIRGLWATGGTVVQTFGESVNHLSVIINTSLAEAAEETKKDMEKARKARENQE